MGPHIVIRISADNVSEREFRRVQRQLNRLERSVSDAGRQTRRTTRSIEGLAEGLGLAGGILTEVARGITAFVVSLVEGAAQLEAYTDAFTALTGSSTLAKQEIDALREVARQPGVDLSQAIQGSINLRAVGVEAGLTNEILVELGNAVALVGGGSDAFNRLNRAIRQTASLGKVLTEELNQAREASPIISAALQEAFGTQDAEIIAERVGTGFRNIQENFLRPLTEALQNQGRAAVDGFNNSLQNLGNAFFDLRSSLGESFLPLATRLVQTLTKAIDAITELNRQTDGLIGDLVLAGTVVATLLTGVTLLITAFAALASGIAAIKGALVTAGIIGAGTALGPIALAIAGVAAGIGALTFLFLRFRRGGDDIEKAAESAERFNKALENTNTIQARESAIQKRIDELKELEEQYKITAGVIIQIGGPGLGLFETRRRFTGGLESTSDILRFLRQNVPGLDLAALTDEIRETGTVSDDNTAAFEQQISEALTRLSDTAGEQLRSIRDERRQLQNQIDELNSEIRSTVRSGATSAVVDVLTGQRDDLVRTLEQTNNEYTVARRQYRRLVEIFRQSDHLASQFLPGIAFRQVRRELERERLTLEANPEAAIRDEINRLQAQISRRTRERQSLVDLQNETRTGTLLRGSVDYLDFLEQEDLREEIEGLDSTIANLNEQFNSLILLQQDYNEEQRAGILGTRNYQLEIFSLTSDIDDIVQSFSNATASENELSAALERGRELIRDRREAQLEEANAALNRAREDLQAAQDRPESEITPEVQQEIDRLTQVVRKAETEVHVVNARIERSFVTSNRSITGAYESELDRRRELREREAEERIREEERIARITEQQLDNIRDANERLRQSYITTRLEATQAGLQSLRSLQEQATSPDIIRDLGRQIRTALIRQRDDTINQLDPELSDVQREAERARITAQFNRLIEQSHEQTASAIRTIYEDLNRQLIDIERNRLDEIDRGNQARFQRELQAARTSFRETAALETERVVTPAQANAIAASNTRIDERVAQARIAIQSSTNTRIRQITRDSERIQAQIRYDNRNSSEVLINALVLEEQRRRNSEIENISREGENAITGIVEQGSQERERILQQDTQNYLKFVNEKVQAERNLEQTRLQIEQGRLAALRTEATQLNQRSAFGAPGLIQNFREQQAQIRRLRDEQIAALDNLGLSGPQIEARTQLINQQTEQQLTQNVQRFTGSVDRLLAPIFQGASDFGSLLADVFRNLPQEAQQEINDLEAETARRIQQIREDQTISADQQARRIERIEQQSAERRIQIERDLNRAKRESFEDFVQNFVRGIGRQISAELQLQAVRSVVGSVASLGLTAGLAAAAPTAAPLLAASAGVAFLTNLSFHNEANDMLARQAGRRSSQRLLENNAARLGRESAHDIVNNFQEGFEDQASGRGGNNIIIPRDATIKIQVPINDKMVQEIQLTAEQLVLEGRL